jgi:hypothetical protein
VNYEWCKDLPEIVSEAHSAWLSRSSRAIIFRPLHFASKSVHYVLAAPESKQETCTESQLEELSLKCYEIPKHQQVCIQCFHHVSSHLVSSSWGDDVPRSVAPLYACVLIAAF